MLTYVIADVHLSAEQPHLYQLFDYFANTILQLGDRLYILGDLFAFWIGDDDASAINQQVTGQLAALHERGIEVFLLLGNRDFLIKQRFATQAKLTLLPEKHVITVANEAMLLLHGDTLCTLDISYQRFRNYTQKKWLQGLFLALPLRWRLKIAAKLRQQSNALRPIENRAILDVVDADVLNMCHDKHVKIMIHGHTHLPGIHAYYQDATWIYRYTLSDWGDTGNYCVMDEAGHKSLEYFTGTRD